MPTQANEVKRGATASIAQVGKCRDKICVWHDSEHNCDVVLDGIMRVEICRENSLPLPEVNYIDLPDRDACQVIIDQQLNRRNLRGWWVAYFRGLKYNSEKRAPHRPSDNVELPQSEGETAKRIAEQAGVSRPTIERNAIFARSIDQLKSDLSEDFGKRILNGNSKSYRWKTLTSWPGCLVKTK